jgi:hypothetical protein
MTRLEREAIACAEYAMACGHWARLQEIMLPWNAPSFGYWLEKLREAYRAVEAKAQRVGLPGLGGLKGKGV